MIPSIPNVFSPPCSSKLIFFFFRVHAVCTRASCTHRRSCLYMPRYFQTEPVKDIQPVVNTGIWGNVSVFYLCCLFTTSLSCGPAIFDWWSRFERIFLNSSKASVPVLDLCLIAKSVTMRKMFIISQALIAKCKRWRTKMLKIDFQPIQVSLESCPCVTVRALCIRNYFYKVSYFNFFLED